MSIPLWEGLPLCFTVGMGVAKNHVEYKNEKKEEKKENPWPVGGLKS